MRSPRIDNPADLFCFTVSSFPPPRSLLRHPAPVSIPPMHQTTPMASKPTIKKPHQSTGQKKPLLLNKHPTSPPLTPILHPRIKRRNTVCIKHSTSTNDALSHTPRPITVQFPTSPSPTPPDSTRHSRCRQPPRRRSPRPGVQAPTLDPAQCPQTLWTRCTRACAQSVSLAGL